MQSTTVLVVYTLCYKMSTLISAILGSSYFVIRQYEYAVNISKPILEIWTQYVKETCERWLCFVNLFCSMIGFRPTYP